MVIPCLNEQWTLKALLEQLIEDAPRARIVVADGGSTDQSRVIVAQMAKAHTQVSLIDNPRRIQSAGVNLAATTHGKDHDWMVRVDAHCLYPREYVTKLIEAALAHDAQSVVVPMVTEGSGCFQIGVAAAQNSLMGTGGSPHRHVGEGRYVDHGHHALFRLDAFLGVGGYDESFSHNEDAELDQRLIGSGTRIWLEPSAHIVYFPRSTALSLLRQYVNYGTGRARTVIKHGLRLKMRQMLPLAIFPILLLAIIGLAIAPWKAEAALLAVPAASWLVLCQVYALMLGIRTRQFCVLASGTAAMIMHAGWSAGYWKALVLPRPY